MSVVGGGMIALRGLAGKTSFATPRDTFGGRLAGLPFGLKVFAALHGSNPSQNDEDDENHKDQPDAAHTIVTVAVAVAPVRIEVRTADSAEQNDDQEDDEDRADAHNWPFQIRHGAASLELSQALKSDSSSVMPCR